MKKIYFFLTQRKQLLFSLAMLLLTSILFTQISFAQQPSNAHRWDAGDGWTYNTTSGTWVPVVYPANNDLPKGIIRCASSAEEEGGLENYAHTYDGVFPIGTNTHCFNPDNNLHDIASVAGPTANVTDIVWFNFDVRPFAGSYQFQIVTNTGDLGWALFYVNDANTQPVDGTNTLSGRFPQNPTGLSGVLGANYSNLVYQDCGTDFNGGWATITVPKFTKPTNYYLAMWPLNTDHFANSANLVYKSRFGCGETPITCSFEKVGDPSLSCNANATYTACQNFAGSNGVWTLQDNAAVKATSYEVTTYAFDGTPKDHYTSTDLSTTSISFTLGNLGSGTAVKATVCATYADGNPYNISLIPSGLPNPPTGYTGCTTGSSFSGDGLIAAPTPAATVTQPDCTTSTGSVQVTNPDASISYTLSQSGTVKYTADANGLFSAVASGTYDLIASLTGGCNTGGGTVKINDAPGQLDKPAATLTQPDCTTATGSVQVTNPVAGVTYTLSQSGTVIYTADASGLFSPVAAGTYDFAATKGSCNTSGDAVTINAAPPQLATPAATVTQPDCTTSTGSVQVTDPVSGVTYTLSQNGSVVYTADANGLFSPVASGSYTLTASETGSCSSTATESVVVNDPPTQLDKPAAPKVTQPTCTSANGSVQVDNPVSGVVYTLSKGGTVYTADDNGLFSAIPPGVYTFTASNGTCSANGDDVTVNAQPQRPVAFNVTGGGAYCSTGTGVAIGTSGSETGVTYQLILNGTTNVGSAVNGTGNALGFGLQTAAGTYTVDATYTSTTCHTSMTGSATITINPTPSCTISNTTSSGSTTTTLGAAVGFSGPTAPAGSTFTYAWSFSSNTSGASFSGGATTATGKTVTVTTTTVGSYTLSLKVTDIAYATNCNSTCTYSVTVGPVGPYYTVTQGFYGNVGGKVTVPSASCSTYVAGSKGNVDGLIATSIKNMPGQQLILGIPGTNGKSFTMGATAAEDKNLIIYMPAGQAAAVITANSGSINNTNITTNLPKLFNKKISSVLLGQAITLKLNVYIPGNTLGSFVLKTDYLTTQKADLSKCPTIKLVACSTDASAISSLQLTTSAGLKTWINTGTKTVMDLLKLDSAALGGGALPAGVTLADLSNATDVINRSFDGARYFLGYYSTAKSCSSNLSKPVYVQNTTLIATELAVSAYPNPFTDKVKFNIVSPVSGNASLDIYNLMGQKIANAYNGYLQAGRSQVIEYNATGAKGTLIYSLKVGDKQVNGSVIHLK